MKKKLTVFVFFILNIWIFAQGNMIEDYNISKKVNVSNNYNTGKVGVSIPLYKIDLGEITLESSLNYKQEIPDGEPSLVGTNWDLNAFGKIVIGYSEPSKIISPYKLVPGPTPDGYNTPQESKFVNVRYCVLSEQVVPSKYAILNSPSLANTKPANTFYFDFFGYSGYMVYDNAGKFIVYCEQGDLKAEFSGDKCYNLHQPIASIPQIIMKDDKGNQFYFGGDFNSADIYYGQVLYNSRCGNCGANYDTYNHVNYLSSLYLKKVVLSSGRTIEAFYKTGNKNVMDPFVNGGVYKNQDYPYGIPSKATLLSNNLFVGVDEAKQYDSKSTYYSSDGVVNEMYTNATIHQKIAVLDYIKISDYGTVNFTYSQLNNKLTKPFLTNLTINSKGKNSNTINFNYIYLNNSSYLQSLANNQDQYHFSYYTDFNTGSGNKGGLLKAVMYPTLGTESFEYEPNVISKRYMFSDDRSVLQNSDMAVEGHRLKKIIKKSGTDSYTKNYYYTNDDFTNSGILTFYDTSSPDYFNSSSYTVTSRYKGKFDEYVRYSQVTEEIIGKEKTKYYFTDLITNPDSIIVPSTTHAPNTYFAGTLRKNDERGKLYKIEKYDKDNMLVFRQETKYTNFLNNATPISEISPTCLTCKITDDRYYLTKSTSRYYQPILPYLPLSVKTQEKIGNAFIESIRSFKYNTSYLYWHPYPIEEKTESLGKVTIRKTYYPGDILRKSPTCITGNCPPDTDLVGEKFSIYKDMIINNINIPVINTLKINSNKTSLTESIYKRNNTSGNLLELDKTRVSLLSSNFTDDTYNQAQVTGKEIFEFYDSRGNLLQTKMDNGLPMTTIWGYNSTLPIAKIRGATYAQVMAALGLDGNNLNSYLDLDIVKKSDLDINDASEQNLLNSLKDFRSTLSGYQISTYTYDPLIGVKSITPPSGIIEFYKYDSWNRLEKVLDSKQNLVKEYTYNYKEPSTYVNAAKSQTFSGNNCNYIQTPDPYTYTIPQGAYASHFSQSDADDMAQDNIKTYGQNEANTNGTCTYKPFDCTISTEFSYNDNSSYFFNKINNLNYDVYYGSICFNTKNYNWGTIGGRQKVGKINGICRPRMFNSQFNPTGWSLTIESNGDIYAKWDKTFSNVTPNQTVIVQFQFAYDK